MRPCPAALAGPPPAARLLAVLCLCALLLVVIGTPARATGPTPWGGSPVAVAASGTTTVQATGYDLGGEGVAYHDIDNGGQTGYRSDNIGVPNAAAFGWAYAGEWEGYTLAVAQAGSYTLTIHANNSAHNGTCHLEFGPVGQAGGAGVTVSPEFLIPYTGSTVGTVQVPGVALPAGTQWMRLVMDTNGDAGYVGNFADIDLTRDGSASRNPVSASATSRIEAEDYDPGGEGVAYHDIVNGGATAHRPDNVGIYPDGNASGGFAVYFDPAGEWYAYTLSVAQAGPYAVTARLGSDHAGGRFHVEFSPVGGAGGTVSTGEFAVPYASGLFSYQDVSVPAVTLPAGQVWMRVVIDDDYPGTLDFFRLTPGALLPTATGLALSPSTAANGGSVGGSVTLSGPAPGTMALTLTSDNAAAHIPAFVTVYAGSTTGYFTVTTSPVSSAVTAHITASGAGSPVTGTLALAPSVSLASLGVFWEEAESFGGGPASPPAAYGYFSLTGPAPAGGVTVALASDCPTAVVPTTVTVPQGLSGGSFAITTSAVSTATTAHITASEGGATQEADLALTPFGLAALYVSPDTVHGGDPATGYIYLTGPAPAGGVTVGLSSDNPSATVPSSVTVPEGQSSVGFAVTTSAVYSPATATITATGPNGPLTATLGLSPVSAPSGLTATAYPTGPASVVVNLNWTAAAGATGYAVERSPDYSTWAQIGTAPGTAYQDTTAAGGTHYWYRVKAVGGTAYSNTAYAATGFPWLIATDLAWAPDPVHAGDHVQFYAVIQNIGTATAPPFNWSVEFEGDAYGGYNIEANPLAPGDTLLVTENSGQYWTATPGTYHPTVVINDSYETLTRTLTVASAAPTGLTATAGNMAIVLNWASFPGASSYNVYRSTTPNGEGTTPYQTGIMGNSFTDNGMFGPDNVFDGLIGGDTYYYEVTALNGNSESVKSNEASAMLTGLTGITINPMSIVTGTSATGTVTLSGPAPTGGAKIVLHCSNLSFTLPTSVTVPEGQASAAFEITGAPAVSGVAATITATYAGVNKTAHVTLVRDMNTQAAIFVSQTIPDTLYAGCSYTVSITMQNSGSDTWTPDTFALSSLVPQSSATWKADRVALAAATPPGNQAVFTFRITAPSVSGTYHFRWGMVGQDNEPFDQSTPDTAVTVVVNTTIAGMPTSVPSPTDLVATATSSSEIDLQWQPSSGTVSGYRVERSLDGATGWQQIATVSGSSYQDTGLQPDTTYYYTVCAFTNDGNSADIDAGTTTLPAPPTGPTSLTASQAILIAQNYCQAIGQPVTVAGIAKYTVVDEPMAVATWRPQWVVTFEGQAEVSVVDSTGVVCDYTDDGYYERDKPQTAAGTLLDQASAIQRATAALQATGQTDGLADPYAAMTQDNDGSQTGDSEWDIIWARQVNGIPYRQSSLVSLDAETGEIRSVGLALPIPAPGTTVVTVTQEQAANFAQAQLTTSGITGVTFVNSTKEILLPNGFWQNGDQTPQPGASSVAWVVSYTSTDNSNGTSQYEVWVDGNTGAVLGGSSQVSMTARKVGSPKHKNKPAPKHKVARPRPVSHKAKPHHNRAHHRSKYRKRS